MGGVENVRAPVAERTGAVGEPAPPVLRVQARAERVDGTRGVPLVPVEPGRQRLPGRESVDDPSVPAPRRVHERDDLRHVLDDAGLGPGLELEVVVAGVSLVPHLRDNAAFRRSRHQQIDFAKRLRDRLLDVDVLPVAHGVHRGREMGMVRRGDDHGVELRAHLVEHRAEVPKHRNRREQFARLGGVCGIEIDVAEGGHVHQPGRGEGLDHVAAAVADADERHAEPRIGRRHPGGRAGRLTGRRARQQDERRAAQRQSGHELAPAHASREAEVRWRFQSHGGSFGITIRRFYGQTGRWMGARTGPDQRGGHRP